MSSMKGSILTLAELANSLKIPQSTLYKLAKEGRIPGQKVGKQWRFHKDGVDRWLNEPIRKDQNNELS